MLIFYTTFLTRSIISISIQLLLSGNLKLSPNSNQFTISYLGLSLGLELYFLARDYVNEKIKHVLLCDGQSYVTSLQLEEKKGREKSGRERG